MQFFPNTTLHKLQEVADISKDYSSPSLMELNKCHGGVDQDTTFRT